MAKRRSKAHNEACAEMIAECEAQLRECPEAPEKARAEAVEAHNAMLVLGSLTKNHDTDEVNLKFARRMHDAVMAAIDRAYLCGLRDGQAAVRG